MPIEMNRCKITVVKRTVNQDLADQYLDAEGFEACDLFADGQEFIVEHPWRMPQGFGCPSAWADIRNDVMLVASGGTLPWIKPRGAALAGCTDWFRPVIFKIERVA